MGSVLTRHLRDLGDIGGFEASNISLPACSESCPAKPTDIQHPRVLEFDPRSPTAEIARTPIEVRVFMLGLNLNGELLYILILRSMSPMEISFFYICFIFLGGFQYLKENGPRLSCIKCVALQEELLRNGSRYVINPRVQLKTR